jgi:carbamoyltransferase
MSRREDVVGSSDRSFGFVFAAVFLLLAALKLWQGSPFGHGWLALSAVLAAAAAVRPSLLAPLNRLAQARPARSPTMQKTLNLRIKYRESFRPFAPSVLREDVADWFELDSDSPYMLLVADVVQRRRRAMTAEEQQLFGIDKLNVPRSEVPAVTHVDYSARIQTVHRETNPRYHALISAFKTLTGCPVIVNTSFNVRGEPIVCTPEDAFHCFMGSEIETLVIGDCLLEKHVQDPALKLDYKNAFELD